MIQLVETKFKFYFVNTEEFRNGNNFLLHFLSFQYKYLKNLQVSDVA